MDSFTSSYIECALWSTHDDGCDSKGEMLDENYDIEDIQGETLAKVESDCAKFQEQAGDMLDMRYERAGHDFWLTRNGHGAGFWDGDWPEHGDALTDIAHSFGECDLYVGDDGKLYISP